MFNNIENISKELGLAKRTQPSATEINTPQGIPTGGAMPTFVVEPSLPAFVKSKEESVPSKSMSGERIARFFIPNTALPCLSFANAQLKYADKIEDYINELQRWHYEVYARKIHYPHKEDYNEKIEEICGKLNEQSPHYPFAYYFATGADDTAAAGAYLLSLSPSKEKKKIERQAVIWLSGIQWLIRMRDALPEEIPDEPEEKTSASNQTVQQKTERKDSKEIELNTEMNALKNVFIAVSDLKDDKGRIKYNIGEIYIVLRFILKGEEWAKNARTFAQYMHHIIGKSVSSIEMAISREKEAFENLPLDDMQGYIAQFKIDNRHGSTRNLDRIAELYDTIKLLLVKHGVI